MSEPHTPLTALEGHDEFLGRHIGPDAGERRRMLETVGAEGMEALIARALPEDIRMDAPLALDGPRSEAEVIDELGRMAARNEVKRSFIGAGYYGTHTPTVIQRNVLENPAWYTAYTPYQPEISQGRLEALLNFQTMVMDLTAMEIANASLLDESTAAAEAMTLCQRVNRRNRGNVFIVDANCHPQTIDVLRGRAAPLGIEVEVRDPGQGLPESGFFGVLLQYPGTDGAVRDPSAAIEAAHAADAMAVVATDLLALTLLTPPGEMGADVVVGSAQRFGVPLFFGGPHAAFMATRDRHKRALPGRLVGVSVDAHGDPAYRLALQTREQHIRREKATSNICTAQALLAVIAAMYAVYHGPDGLTRIARRVHRLGAILAQGLRELGWGVVDAPFFDTIAVDAGDAADGRLAAAMDAGYNLRDLGAGRIGIALDETATREDVAALLAVFADDAAVPEVAALDERVADALPAGLARQSAFLTHPVFHRYRSETEMLRYLRRLADYDLALDRAMIPLGSCTMKLNATTEMLAVSWAAFSGIHPFAPAAQTGGYRELFADLERMLCAVTGYDAVSLQPNAGAQGEYAGLLAIRDYHRDRGEPERDVCLIPSSAHGTNPASAQMAGMRVVVVRCDGDGNIDMDDLRARLAEHGERLAAIMITYPSTHGVFETTVREVCSLVHEHGGQVYIDGANLNAMVGLTQPGEFGGDVSHVNLHKTFCIPHGGGGPGVGPIGVRAHLAPYLPGHRYGGVESGGVPVAAAPWGSAGILPISWAYMRLMGASGLTDATEVAILNANYIAARLRDAYPVLYTGRDGLVAHECIIDLRPIKDETGVTVDDVAKRLIDYGFHAPTMSFPVAGTLMIEPTESESQAELDRFCDAMLAIREEVRAIERGDLAADDSPLRHAPHTPADLVGEWDRAYSRESAVFPMAGQRQGKYWSPVARIDNVYGDRNLVCACPPMSEYMDEPQREGVGS
ncbi:Glycine dehydrogenase (decarboxylating) [wastewater metagenome]|uniref:glycine dehydrogenase (aminomethyl-transferring) n=2 Tax=unclassified sequences TaxID=12908 RepID=A0A5B8RD24_9ZZZZ|nr:MULTISPECIES: aminomethyl-transferring glycine dehydrogenase [Arhodomonas]MCS4505324.1 aminomethyl-transferring glycine dehydrogenase [Arhodomonas aquaeolei]QEA06013.1 glycine dehydrogenase (decarboxylating) [uncultured organism]